MKRDINMELFSEPVNYAVVRLPGRKFPGVEATNSASGRTQSSFPTIVATTRRNLETNDERIHEIEMIPDKRWRT